MGLTNIAIPGNNAAVASSPLNSARSTLSETSRMKALKWKRRDAARKEAQLRLQKECGYSKSASNVIAADLIGSHEGLWEMAPPTPELLKELAADIEKKWTKKGEVASVGSSNNSNSDSSNVGISSSQVPSCSGDSGVPATEGRGGLPAASKGNSTARRDIWTEMIMDKIRKGREDDLVKKTKEAEAKRAYVKVLDAQLNATAKKINDQKELSVREREIQTREYQQYLETERVKAAVKKEKEMLHQREQRELFEKVQLEAQKIADKKRAEEAELAQKAREDAENDVKAKKERVQKNKVEVAKVKVENDRLLLLKAAQKKQEILNDLEAQRKYSEMEDEKARKRAEVLLNQSKAIEAKMNRGHDYIKKKENKDAEEEERRAEHQRQRWLREEQLAAKKREDAHNRSVEIQRYLQDQIALKQVQTEQEKAAAMTLAHRLALETQRAVETETQKQRDIRARNAQHRAFIENQIVSKKSEADTLDETPVEFKLNLKTLKTLFDDAEEIVSPVNTTRAPEPPSAASSRRPSKPAATTGRKFIASTRGKAPPSHFRI